MGTVIRAGRRRRQELLLVQLQVEDRRGRGNGPRPFLLVPATRQGRAAAGTEQAD